LYLSIKKVQDKDITHQTPRIDFRLIQDIVCDFLCLFPIKG